jgi:hypothetical protein
VRKIDRDRDIIFVGEILEGRLGENLLVEQLAVAAPIRTGEIEQE